MLYILGFRFRLFAETQRRWGGVLKNGTATGMVGFVARHKAEFAIDEITITGTVLPLPRTASLGP